jgi:hypothetical protein
MIHMFLMYVKMVKFCMKETQICLKILVSFRSQKFLVNPESIANGQRKNS